MLARLKGNATTPIFCDKDILLNKVYRFIKYLSIGSNFRSTTGFFLWASGHSHAKAYYYLLFEIVIFAFSILTYTTIWNVFRASTEKFQRLCGDGGGKCEAKKKQLKMYSIFLIITSFLVCNIVPGTDFLFSSDNQKCS